MAVTRDAQGRPVTCRADCGEKAERWLGLVASRGPEDADLALGDLKRPGARVLRELADLGWEVTFPARGVVRYRQKSAAEIALVRLGVPNARALAERAAGDGDPENTALKSLEGLGPVAPARRPLERGR